MNARVTTTQSTPENLDDAVRRFKEEALPSITAMEGFKGAYLLIDRATGKVVNVSLWETEALETSSAAAVADLRARLTSSSNTSVESFEVVVQPGEDEGQRLAAAVAQAARELEGQVRKFAASDEVSKVRRQVENSLKTFEEWARRKGGPPPQD
jgi:heme-degrading monooxygenase HmoA